ncbi:hypothetical protein KIP88_32700 [Bradyrhizobium sp. SRL28]|uniref:hypothetical protein n=1 Tax=Bradyrhizobium sp. SRL28 TaxID=2836178 RepID=UPI001BDE28D6|nr:hypothetical protein [Bradyrhizobium sp. SRL28]MBT1515254.1 hypothetical protein [Bradyrhizobium sp. SRL28]
MLISQRIKGQFGHVPPDIRAWFKSVIAPNGVPCCDESDGHRTTYDVRVGAYWVDSLKMTPVPQDDNLAETERSRP